MKISTLCFCLTDDAILLALKKEGFGKGKWNGPGGKQKTGETIRAATVREIKEESRVRVWQKDLQYCAIIDFYFDKDWVFQCHVFATRVWHGEPGETEEMRPRWFPRTDIPYRRMWSADKKWLPLVLSGLTFKALVRFDKRGKRILEFSYHEEKL
jgi:ADP-ribose pyrophosphatase YjhB (NUDIX family)